jgi:predicted RNA binding protein YcfA (HicA-like mRNA interferase family)
MDKKNKLEKWFDDFRESSDTPAPISQRLGIEYDPFYLDLEMLEGGPSYNSKIEASINDWLDSIENDHRFDDSDETGPFEKLAWYSQITFNGLDAGIFVTVEGLGFYGSRIRRALRAHSPTSDLGRVSLLGAYYVMLCHELFHHRVEWFAFKIGNSFQRDGFQTYSDYWRQVYFPHANPYDDDLLEEALASASMIHSLANLGGKNLYTKVELTAIKEALKAGFPTKPRGYRQAINYVSFKSYKVGLRNLGKSIHDSSLFLSNQPIMNPSFAIGASTLDKYFINTAQVVSTSNSVQASNFPPIGISVPHRKITELLKKKGYEPTAKGKGSHTVWESQGKPSVTLPHRSDQEGYQVLQNVAKSLGLDSLRALQNEIKAL